jgi:hypothetical protein
MNIRQSVALKEEQARVSSEFQNQIIEAEVAKWDNKRRTCLMEQKL